MCTYNAEMTFQKSKQVEPKENIQGEREKAYRDILIAKPEGRQT